MCKIVILTNASKVKDFDGLTRLLALEMGMPDGYGHAVQGVKGVFGVRSLSPTLYSKHNGPIPSFCVNPTVPFGEQSSINGAAIIHGRMSTNSVSLVNTHPISKDAWHVIHNGVVTHHGDKYTMQTSNDSEHVLHNLTQGIDKVAANLTGYYAVGAIDPKGRLHVIRDSIAQLHYAYSQNLECGIFATTSDLIESIAEFIKEPLVSMSVKDNTYLVYENNKLVSESTFVSRGYDDYSKSHAVTSLGKSLDDNGLISETIEVSEEYLDEIDNYLDDSYSITMGFKEIDAQEFKTLPLDIQIECEVRRLDGTIVSPYSDNTVDIYEVDDYYQWPSMLPKKRA